MCTLVVVLFIFKQKTAYDIEYGLVGSEMCIRDRLWRGERDRDQLPCAGRESWQAHFPAQPDDPQPCGCLLYTSDAADERSSVDLGGRRIIKKQKKDE